MALDTESSPGFGWCDRWGDEEAPKPTGELEVMVDPYRTFEVNVRRDGRWWLIDIPELDTSGQARNLAEVEFEARDIIATVIEADFDSVKVNLRLELPPDISRLWADANAHEARARQISVQAASERRQVVRDLAAQGISQADVARALHLSPQRVSQLARVPADHC